MDGKVVTTASREMMRQMSQVPPAGALSRKPKLAPKGFMRGMQHPMPYIHMWRGQFAGYLYNQSATARWGEGDTRHRYHQHYAHAKDPLDYGRVGADYELLKVTRGKMNRKPLPAPQYVDPKSKPTWVFRSWLDQQSTMEVWQRELQYSEHVPTHLGAKRPLCPLAPSTFHRHMHLAYITKIDVTVSPFVFGFGHTLQKTVMDFYRKCLAARSAFPKDKVHLHYSIDYVAPRVEVTWQDGSVFAPPLLEGTNSQTLVQTIMEQAWLVRDRLEASGKVLQPLPIDDYKWNELIQFQKAKKVAAAKGAKKK
jgi:hypothetical protein